MQHPNVYAAARVGLGSLGVITEVTLQLERAFSVRSNQTLVRTQRMLEDLPTLMCVPAPRTLQAHAC